MRRENFITINTLFIQNENAGNGNISLKTNVKTVINNISDFNDIELRDN